MELQNGEGSDGNKGHENDKQSANLGACTSSLAKVREALLDAVGGGGDGRAVKSSLLFQNRRQGGHVPGQNSCLYLIKSFWALHRGDQGRDGGVIQLQTLKDGGEQCLWIAPLLIREAEQGGDATLVLVKQRPNLLKSIADVAGLARFWFGLRLWLAALTLWTTKCLRDT